MLFRMCHGEGEWDLTIRLYCGKDLRPFSFILEQNSSFCKRKTLLLEGPWLPVAEEAAAASVAPHPDGCSGSPGVISFLSAGPATSTAALS